MPLRPVGSRDTAMLHAIVNWLEVDLRDATGQYRNLRWAPDGDTYCNIYAYDYAFLAGAPMPRLWWTPAGKQAFSDGKLAIKLDSRGLPRTPLTKAAYGPWLIELNANALQPWFEVEGPNYGWRKVSSVEAAQAAANKGQVVVWVGAKKIVSNHGHITAIVPESSVFRAVRDVAGRMVTPLQSQAGAKNKRYHTDNLFTGNSWKATGLYVCD
jgi:hypothetical protein